MRSRRNTATAHRSLLVILLVIAGLANAGPARALPADDSLWSPPITRQAGFTLGFDDPILSALIEGASFPDVQTQEHRIPLITPRWITGTPAEPGSDVVCLSLLTVEGMAYQEAKPTEGIATPVRLPEKGIGGVRYRYYYPGRTPRIIDCRLALALLRAAPVLKANGVAEVVFLNHYRPSFGRFKRGQYNFHSQGLAINVWGFKTYSGLKLDIRRDYETGLGFVDPHSCLGRPMTMKGMLLRKIACDLDASDAFEAILTPDYDAQHWNHYHLSAFHSQQLSRLRPRGTALLEVPITDLTAWALRRSIRQQPELRRWDEVAARQWPEKHRWIRAKLGLPAEPTDAELAAQLLEGDSPVGVIWSTLLGFVDRLAPELEDATRETLEPTLDALSDAVPAEPLSHPPKATR